MIDAIIARLKSAFPNYKIYTENVEQGLNPPCFSVLEISAEGNRFLQNRHKRTCQFMVHFFPSKNDAYNDCSVMLHNLLILLVDVGKWHSTKLNGTISDGVLNFEVVYSEFVDIVEETENMGDYKHTVNGVKVND